jgi:hypothetical protein
MNHPQPLLPLLVAITAATIPQSIQTTRISTQLPPHCWGRRHRLANVFHVSPVTDCAGKGIDSACSKHSRPEGDVDSSIDNQKEQRNDELRSCLASITRSVCTAYLRRILRLVMLLLRQSGARHEEQEKNEWDSHEQSIQH